ncbi:MAG: hypothetical protein WBV71_18355 [Roseobacter sp.]
MAKSIWCSVWIGFAAALSGCDAAGLNAASGEYVVVGPAAAHSSNPLGGKY